MSTADFVPDELSLGRPALTPARRVEALIKCLANHWADRDIAAVGRVDGPDRRGWTLEARATPPPREPAD